MVVVGLTRVERVGWRRLDPLGGGDVVPGVPFELGGAVGPEPHQLMPGYGNRGRDAYKAEIDRAVVILKEVLPLFAVRPSGEQQLVIVEEAGPGHGDGAERVAGRSELDVFARHLLRAEGRAPVQGEESIGLLLQVAADRLGAGKLPVPAHYAGGVEGQGNDGTAAYLGRGESQPGATGAGGGDRDSVQEIRQLGGGVGERVGAGHAAAAGDLHDVPVGGAGTEAQGDDRIGAGTKRHVWSRIGRLILAGVDHAGRVSFGFERDDGGKNVIGVGGYSR